MPKSPRAGRPPKAPEILKLEGNFRGHKPEHKYRPTLTSDTLPEKPADLDGEAGEYWDRLMRYRPEWWDQSDAEAMAFLARVWAASQEAWRRKDDSKDGYRKFLDYQKAWYNLAACFGLTPLDRLRMPVAPKKQKTDAKEFLA